MIRFYYHPTPNPAKVALFLEDTGLRYEIVPVDTVPPKAPEVETPTHQDQIS